MNQFRFANVEWLHALWLVAICGLILVACEFRGARILERMLSPLMQSRLVRRPSLGRRVIGVWLLCGALAALVIALMRPQWGSTVQVQTRVDSQIMVCLDVSRSMLAEDVVPNRLERAKAEIDSLLSNMQDGQQVGLMAFAGKASVLCPLTTDFGFLRLILAEANPGTVGLGGTHIGEAISKAVDGFREVGDVNRLILLITDGEDHDSFPLDAAKQAREKGVRIVSIGFGDELGSKIEISDPQTGARSYIEDREGRPVISRLDGETLRQIALETEGAYIPAGTGALDWQSIYTSHIAGFLGGATDQEETVIRNEAYQWCVLVALVLLLAALATPTFFSAEDPISRTNAMNITTGSRAAVWLVWGLGLSGPVCSAPIWAQDPMPLTGPAASTTSPNSAKNSLSQLSGTAADDNGPSSHASTASAADQEANSSPRELYNRAVALVNSDADQAERLLNAARRVAQVDGELRYRSIYNLGWVEVHRAQELLEKEPEQALKHLEMAAGRFREAIRVRSDSDAARHNLEIISRRILQLSDSLAKKSPTEYAERLDELINHIREHQTELQQLANQLASIGTDRNSRVENYRHDFRQLAVRERQIISDVEKLAADARRQLTAEQTTKGNQPASAAQGQLPAAQISAMLRYLDSSVQRMHLARSFVRRLQSERAFVRWAAGLTDAKRARDQLRDPLEILSVIIGDATQLRDLSLLMDQPTVNKKERAVPATGQVIGPSRPSRPGWLSDELVTDEQLATTQRTAELHALLTAGVAQAAQPSPSTPQAVTPPDDQQQQMSANIQQALPLVAAARSHFDQASQSIEDRAWPKTVEQQTAGITDLQAAAEMFFDIRRLIDTSLEDQQRIAAGVKSLAPRTSPTPATETSAMPALGLQQVADRSALLTDQRENIQRMERLASLIQQELSELEAASATAKDSSSAPAPDAADEPAAADPAVASQAETDLQIQRFELAEKLRANAAESMQQVLGHLATQADPAVDSNKSTLTVAVPEAVPVERPPAPRRRADDQHEKLATPPVAESPSPLDQATDTTVEQLEELQRLFFSVVEHLRETAGRQTELSDSTSELIAQPERQTPDRIGPLQHRQQALQQTAKAIADALQEQADATAETDSTANKDVTNNDNQPSAAGANGPSQSPQPTGVNAADNAADVKTQDGAEKLSQAAALVQEGAHAMQAAAEQLTAAVTAEPDSASEQPPPTGTAPDGAIKQTEVHQQTALQKLLEALELLDPPQSQEQNSPQQQPQQQPQDKSDEKTEATPQNMDAEQMLQAIREREANRRRERQPQHPTSAGGVEKDW